MVRMWASCSLEGLVASRTPPPFFSEVSRLPPRPNSFGVCVSVCVVLGARAFALGLCV